MIALTLVGVSPALNPDRLIFKAVFSGNYGVQGTGDPLNIAPYDAVNNPGGWTNPAGLPVPELPLGLDFAPEVASENIGGYYVEPQPLLPGAPANGVAPTLNLKTGNFLKMFAPGGGELASNAAYNAAVIAAGAGVLLEVILPKNQ